MVRRYLGTACMALLIGLWLASGVYAFLRLRRTTILAEGVQRGTQVLREELENPRIEAPATSAFPEERVARLIRPSWSVGVAERAFPRGLITEYTGPVERPRAAR